MFRGIGGTTWYWGKRWRISLHRNITIGPSSTGASNWTETATSTTGGRLNSGSFVDGFIQPFLSAIQVAPAAYPSVTTDRWTGDDGYGPSADINTSISERTPKSGR